MISTRVYDVFLSYSSKDRSFIKEIANKLNILGLRPWFDQTCIIPGLEFQAQIEEGLNQSQSIAVFVGSNGMGPWEEKEFRASLMDRIGKNESPIIPVLLPGSKEIYSKLPAFLRGNSYVDFTNGLSDHDALLSLVAGIKGIRPDEVLQEKIMLDLENRPISTPIRSILKRNTIRTYNDIAEKFTEKWFHHPPTEILELLLENIPKKSKILDAGCGPGHHSQYLSKKGHDVIGIDLSKRMLEIAQASTNGPEFQSMDIQYLEFPRKSFDCIWSAGSSLHVPREELTNLLYGYKSILKPTGVMGLNLQIERQSEIAEDGRFFEFYRSKGEIVNLLTYVGFRVIAENYGEITRNTHDLDLTLKWVTFYCENNVMLV